jgi:hypothetical protein
MQRYQLRKPTSFLKQDTVALVAVAGYVIFVFLLMKGWGFLSKEANAFVSNVGHFITPTTALTVQLHASVAYQNPSSDGNNTSSTDRNVIVMAPNQDPNLQSPMIMACPSALAKTCDEMKMMFPE